MGKFLNIGKCFLKIKRCIGMWERFQSSSAAQNILNLTSSCQCQFCRRAPPFSLGNCWLAIWGEWKQNLEAARPYPADPPSLSGKEQTSSGPFLRIPVYLCCDDHKQNFRHWPGWAKLLPSPESLCTLDLAVDQNHHKLFYLRYTFKVSYNWIVNERWLPRSKRGLQTIAPGPDWGCCLFS